MPKTKELKPAIATKYRKALEAYYYPTSPTHTIRGASWKLATGNKNLKACATRFREMMLNPLAADLIAQVREEGRKLQEELNEERKQLWKTQAMGFFEAIALLSRVARHNGYINPAWKSIEDIPEEIQALASRIEVDTNGNLKISWKPWTASMQMLHGYHKMSNELLGEEKKGEEHNGGVIILPGNGRLLDPEKYGLPEGS